jgi:hypothetical protein
MQVFFETIEGDLPDKAIMKAMGAPVSDMQKLCIPSVNCH